MNKLLFFAAILVAFAFTSCKKDRTCTCTTTSTSSGGTSTSSTSTVKYTKVKKHDVAGSCVSSSQTYDDGSSWSTDCSLS